jgi:hypothetical protein
MLDFDKNEVFEGFEGEFKKKKRVRRSMGNFPAWGMLLILLAVAGALYGYFQGAFTPKTAVVSKAVTVTISTETSALTPDALKSTLDANPVTASDPSSEAIQTALIQPTAKPNLIQRIALLFNPEKNSDDTPKLTATPRPKPEKLNFFQTILYALNPDWLRGSTATLIPVKSATPQPPAFTALPEETVPAESTTTTLKLEETATLPAPGMDTLAIPVTRQSPAETQFVSETAATMQQPSTTEAAQELTATFPATVIPVVISTQKAAVTAIALPDQTRTVPAVAGTMISGANVLSSPEKITTITPLVMSTALRKDVTSIEPATELPILTSMTATKKEPATSTEVARVIETATSAATEPTSTQAPSPTPEPTRSPNFFQRFIDSLFPRRTPVPTVTATATITPTPTVAPSATRTEEVFSSLESQLESTLIVSMPTVTFQILTDRASPTTISGSTSEPKMVPSMIETGFVPRRDETAAPVVKTTSTLEQIAVQSIHIQTSVAQDAIAGISTQTSQLPVLTGAMQNQTVAVLVPTQATVVTLEQKQSDLFDEPLFFEEDTPVPGSPATVAPTVASTLSDHMSNNLAPLLSNTAVPLKNTDSPVYQPTRLPDTGFADQWNIPMMILVVMVLLALILTVRLLRNKR